MANDKNLGTDGFTNGALYDEARPNYPAAAIDYFVSTLGVEPTTRVLDLGAGTGIFTRQMAPFVGSVVAVDPSASMRAALLASAPDVLVLDGSDTAIPLSDESVDVVFVAQAFHWFDAPRALREIHRVLVPGGGLGLIWNERDESIPWVAALSRAMEWDVKQPYDVGTDFTNVIGRGPFDEVERVRFTHEQTLSREGLRRRVLTTSYIATMSEDDRQALMRDVDVVVNELPEPITLPYVTNAYTAKAVVD
jgi:SAM-dependent methyltransferase